MNIKSAAHFPLTLLPNRTGRTYTGGVMIDRLQRRPKPEDNLTPEDWVGSITRANNPGDPPDAGLSSVLLPDGTRLLLLDLLKRDPAAFLGERHAAAYGADTGLLVKLLDSKVRLPIQAHPSRAYVQKHLTGRYGKTESWLVLDTRVIDGEEPYLLVGFKPGIDPQTWRRLTDTQDIAGQIDRLHRFPTQAGDIWFLPAGLVHAIGSGVFMVEVQEPSDWVVLTEFSVGDVQIPMDVCHMGVGFDLAMQAFDYTGRPAAEIEQRYRRQPRLLRETPGGKEWEYIGPRDTTYFGARRLDVASQVDVAGEGFYTAVAIQGDGAVEGNFGRVPIRQGNGLFIPASVGPHRFVRTGDGPLQVMRCLPPRE